MIDIIILQEDNEHQIATYASSIIPKIDEFLEDDMNNCYKVMNVTHRIYGILKVTDIRAYSNSVILHVKRL